MGASQKKKARGPLSIVRLVRDAYFGGCPKSIHCAKMSQTYGLLSRLKRTSTAVRRAQSSVGGGVNFEFS